jgi:3-oxoacyl-[acyl-carrier-protein] synthase II
MAEETTIVITGMGAVTPLGGTFPTTWQRLLNGDDAAAPVTVFHTNGCRCRHAAEAIIPDWPQVPEKKRQRWARASLMAVPAAAEALAQARLLDDHSRSRLATLPLSVSTTGGGMALGEAFLREVRLGHGPKDQFFRVARYSAQQQALDLQEALGFRGPVTIVANACASGANAIGHARDLIRRGDADTVLTGGFEALTELIYVGFDCLQAMTTETCRPFDRNRSGLMLGESAAFMVLESEAHARARGAEILGVLAGYGHGTDLHHLTQPQPEGQTQVRVIQEALADAGLSATDIAYVNAHGTGTKLNDASECAAFEQVFHLAGTGAGPWISSTKSAIGHTLGAAGAIEALITLQALRTGDLPPQINLQDPEPSVAERLVRKSERVTNATAMMSVNLGFGGSNAALIFSKVSQSNVAGHARRLASGSDVHCSTPAERRGYNSGVEGIAISGIGAVSPCGCGADALLRPDPVEAIMVDGLSGKAHRAMTVNLKEGRLAEWPLHPRVRRASPITIFMIEAAQQAIDQAGNVDRSRLGIVACFGSGSLILSRKFFDGVLKNGQRFASPNLFPETVYNSPTSHMAAVLGVSGPCYSVVGDDSAWVTGIGVASGWLRDGLVDHALVVGAEELDPVILDAYQAGRVGGGDNLFAGAEGAGAVLLQRATELQAGNIALIRQVTEGWTYRDKNAARQAADACASAISDVELAARTSQHTWLSDIEYQMGHNRGWTLTEPLPYCGYAFAASAAWHTIRALAAAQAAARSVAVPILGMNEQCAAIVVSPLSTPMVNP